MDKDCGCEYATWIDNDFICKILGSPCKQSVPDSKVCYTYDMESTKRKKEYAFDGRSK